eukprot:6179545-Pyramimonas_sp.AAC.1
MALSPDAGASELAARPPSADGGREPRRVDPEGGLGELLRSSRCQWLRSLASASVARASKLGLGATPPSGCHLTR